MKRNLILALVIVLALILVAGLGFTAVSTMTASAATRTATTLPSLSSVPQLGTVSDFEGTLENVYAQVNPSVVAIDVVESSTTTVPNHPTIPGFPQSGVPQQASGSGFVWDTQGHIVTNNHVVDGASKVSVTFWDGTIVPATVVGTDANSDLAVIKVDVPASQLHPVQMADSTQVKVGQLAIAIGNPFDEQNTMTTGIISALGRSLPVNDGTAQGPSYQIPDVIQTDAPINPGNSGGVLLNAQGQVVGVTSAIESPVRASSGIGFAIPSAIVQKVVPSLVSSGHYNSPYLGISGTTLTPDLAKAMGLKSDQRGALVVSVTPNGPAEKAGVHGGAQQSNVNGSQTPVGGDVITAIDGQTVKSFDDVIAYLARSTQVGQTVTLTILRGGQQQNIQVALGVRPNS